LDRIKGGIPVLEARFLKAPRVKGISVPHYKNTENIETAALLEPERVTLLLSQHIGKPAEACVEKGQQVYVGTKVGQASGFVSAAVHASVSGRVIELTQVMVPSGATVDAVVIESDGQFTPDPGIQPPVVRTAKELVSAIAQSGLVGLGGAGFPAHVKFSPPEGSVLDTLVINGAECEPFITSDYREMMENADWILSGVETIRSLMGLKRAVIGIENNKSEAIRLLREKAGASGVEVVALQCAYPQGAEKVLIANLMGRAVPAGKLPSDAGVVVVNVTTCSFVAQYLKTGMPLVQKRVTVDGGAVARPGNLLVPVGTHIRDLIAACGGYREPAVKLLMGGPMMGTALYTDDYPILKNNNGILALSAAQVTLTADNPCIRCGRCVDTCPMGLSPAEIQVSYVQDDIASAEKMGAMSCIECGSCTFVCPAKRPITQIMRLSKEKIRKAASKK
jgi:electron transport complex protein RnfC